jgi:hypothetical protein
MRATPHASSRRKAAKRSGAASVGSDGKTSAAAKPSSTAPKANTPLVDASSGHGVSCDHKRKGVRGA